METTTVNTKRIKPIPAVFLDRDGTIIEDRGYLSDSSQVVFFKDTVSSLRRLSEHFALFIVTNESGVAKGLITMQDVENVNNYIVSYLARHGIQLQESYVCPHASVSACRCIKPNPYFLKKAERDFGIDLGRSFVIGDHPHDVELAKNAGADAIYLLSGHGMKHRDEIAEDTVVAEGIGKATEVILERVKTIQEVENNQWTGT